jgi:hypothetical protein
MSFGRRGLFVSLATVLVAACDHEGFDPREVAGAWAVTHVAESTCENQIVPAEPATVDLWMGRRVVIEFSGDDVIASTNGAAWHFTEPQKREDAWEWTLLRSDGNGRDGLVIGPNVESGAPGGIGISMGLGYGPEGCPKRATLLSLGKRVDP